MAREFECGDCGVVFERDEEPEHAPDCEYREPLGQESAESHDGAAADVGR